jgi:hypothetical protein
VEDEEQPKLSLGLFARQFRAFDRDGLTAEFDVPDHWQITTMSAFGRIPHAAGTARPATAESAGGARRRRPLSELSWPAGEIR